VAHGAPTLDDMAAHRPQPALSVDLTQLVGTIAAEGLKRIRKPGPDRVFVYRVASAVGVSYVVREGRMTSAELFPPGAVVEMVDGFPDQKTATHAWWRLEHGYRRPVAQPWKRCAGQR
jgi:hypothetical protein